MAKIISNVKVEWTVSIITIAAWLIFLGIFYQKIVTNIDDIKSIGERTSTLESKCKDFEVEYGKVGVEVKYIKQNTDEIKTMIVKHVEKDK